MKRNLTLISYLLITISLLFLSLITDNYFSGFFMASFLFMLLAALVEAKEYFSNYWNTIENKFISMVYNQVSYDEIKRTLKISDKTLKKLIDKFKSDNDNT